MSKVRYNSSKVFELLGKLEDNPDYLVQIIKGNYFISDSVTKQFIESGSLKVDSIPLTRDDQVYRKEVKPVPVRTPLKEAEDDTTKKCKMAKSLNQIIYKSKLRRMARESGIYLRQDGRDYIMVKEQIENTGMGKELPQFNNHYFTTDYKLLYSEILIAQIVKESGWEKIVGWKQKIVTYN